MITDCCVCSFSRLIIGQDNPPSDFDLDSDYFFLFGVGNGGRGEHSYSCSTHRLTAGWYVCCTSLTHIFHSSSHTDSPNAELFPQHEATPPISIGQFNPVRDNGEITPEGLLGEVTAPVCL